MERLFLNVVSLSMTCSMVLVPLLILARILRRRYTARTLYTLWLLLGLRLLFPVRLSLPQTPITIPAPVYTLMLPATAPVGMEGTAALGGAAAGSSGVALAVVLAAIWAAGVIAFLLVQGGAYLLVHRRLLWGAAVEEGPVLAEGVRVVRSGRADTPMLLGLVRPVLILPTVEVGREALDLVMRHELCHLKRRDHFYKGFLLLVNAIHWFNPIVWLLVRAADRNLEFCCDEEVLRNAPRAERRRYGEVLLDTAAAGRAPIFAARFGGSKREMKERLSNLFAQKKRGVVLVCVLAAAVLLLGALVGFGPRADDTPYRDAGASGEPSFPPDSQTSQPQIPVATSGPGVVGNDSAANLAAAAEKGMGVDFPFIDYASDDVLVFHDYWGLAVYDFRQCQTVRVLDTPSLGMNLIQGDRYTEVNVVHGLERIYLYNMPGATDAYLYLLGGDTVQAVPIEQAEAEIGAESGTKGTFFFPEGQEPVMKNLTYREQDGTQWRVFENSDAWYWPLDGQYAISSTFGARLHPSTGARLDHTGTDIRADEGTPIHAAQGGRVAEAGYDETLGNYIKLDHGDGVATLYGQMKSVEAAVGETVGKGQVLGFVSATGQATGPHLHLELWTDGARADVLSHYARLENKLSYQ